MSDSLNFYYENYNEDIRLSKDRVHSIEFLTTTRYFNKLFQKNSNILDACSGTGNYSFYLAENGHIVTAGDIVPHNVSIIKTKQEKNPLLKEIYTGSILDLSRFDANSFDVVLCMGALYHLSNKADQEKVMCECSRVLKPNGMLVVSYINKYASIVAHCKDSLENIYELKNKGTPHPLFSISTPKEIETLLKDSGYSLLYNIGTDGISYMLKDKIESASQENFENWLHYHFSTCEEESTLGYSLHALCFARKI